MAKSDFEFVCNLMKTFLADENLKDRLINISKHSITGWEIWLQVEFKIWLEDHASDSELMISEIYREGLYGFDKRKEKSKSSMAIDFLIRRKNHAIDQYIAIELKQNENVTSCLSAMIKDYDKVLKVKSSHDDHRSIWSIGLHGCGKYEYSAIPQVVSDKILTHNEQNTSLTIRKFMTIEIPGTLYYVTILGNKKS